MSDLPDVAAPVVDVPQGELAPNRGGARAALGGPGASDTAIHPAQVVAAAQAAPV